VQKNIPKFSQRAIEKKRKQPGMSRPNIPREKTADKKKGSQGGDGQGWTKEQRSHGKRNYQQKAGKAGHIKKTPSCNHPISNSDGKGTESEARIIANRSVAKKKS